jgi:hypothetical protein
MAADFAHILFGERIELGHDFGFASTLFGKDIRIECHIMVGSEVPHFALPLDASRLR